MHRGTQELLATVKAVLDALMIFLPLSLGLILVVWIILMVW